MNKILLLGIILVNALTIYFVKYHSISMQDAQAYRLADILMEETNDQIAFHNGEIVRKHTEIAQFFFQHKTKVVDAYDSVQIFYKNPSQCIHKAQLELDSVGFQTHFVYNFDKLFQQNILNHTIAKQALTQKKLHSILSEINIAQRRMLEMFYEKEWFADWKKKNWLNTLIIKKRLLNVSTTHLKLELQLLKNDLWVAINAALKTLDQSYQPITTFENITPIIYTEKNIIELGDTYEAKIIFAPSIVPAQDSLVQIKIDGKSIPIENGIGYFDIPTQKIGKFEYKVKYRVKYPYGNKYETYQRVSEYEVIECK